MSDQPMKTPTEDLLRGVPRDHRILVEEKHSSHHIPIGRLAHEAAAEITALRVRVEALETGMRAIEDWDSNWAQGVDENVDAIRDYARALLEGDAAIRDFARTLLEQEP